jgi:hypothetical protein
MLIGKAKEAFKEIVDSLVPKGLNLSFQFSYIQHDRSITNNNDYKTILVRDLDIWKKPTAVSI